MPKILQKPQSIQKKKPPESDFENNIKRLTRDELIDFQKQQEQSLMLASLVNQMMIAALEFSKSHGLKNPVAYWFADFISDTYEQSKSQGWSADDLNIKIISNFVKKTLDLEASETQHPFTQHMEWIDDGKQLVESIKMDNIDFDGFDLTSESNEPGGSSSQPGR